MTEGVFYTTEPYRPNGVNRPGQAGSTGDAAMVKDEGATPARFKTVAAFCTEYVPISHVVEPFIRSSSLYTLTARTGRARRRYSSSWRWPSPPAEVRSFWAARSREAASPLSWLRTPMGYACG